MINRGFLKGLMAFLLLSAVLACKKELAQEDDAKVKPPVRTYVVTARIDKKGTNSNSEATAVLKGEYDESTKVLVYTLECEKIEPVLITLRSGAKGSIGAMIAEIYRKKPEVPVVYPVKGLYTLSPLQERNLLKGLWTVAVNSASMTPEISGVLTLKQK